MSVEWPSSEPRPANGSAAHIEYLPGPSDVSVGVHRCTICGERIHTSKRVRAHGCSPEIECPDCGGAVEPHWTPMLVSPVVNECRSCGHQFVDKTAQGVGGGGV